METTVFFTFGIMYLCLLAITLFVITKLINSIATKDTELENPILIENLVINGKRCYLRARYTNGKISGYVLMEEEDNNENKVEVRNVNRSN